MRSAFLSISTNLWLSILLAYSSFFLFADQNLIAPNLSAIADEFGFSSEEKDQKLGADLSLGFFIVGAPAALLCGYLTDTYNRLYLFVIVLGLGALACLCTYFARDYNDLYTCRVITGIGIGGSSPILYSMLADMYPGTERTLVNTMMGVSSAAGVSAGQLLAGLLGPSLGWRVPFLFVSVPALGGTLLLALTCSEPKRGRGEDEYIIRVSRDASRDQEKRPIFSPISTGGESRRSHSDSQHGQGSNIDKYSHSQQADTVEYQNTEPDYSEKIDFTKIKALFLIKTVDLVFLQGFPGCLPWGMISVFLNDYFSANRGMSVAEATQILTIFGVGGLAGQLLGGIAGQRLYNRRKYYQSLLMAFSTFLAIPAMLYLINAPAEGPFFSFMAFVAGFACSMNGPNVRSMLQNVCTPEVRGTAFAIFTLTDDLGKGLGPVFIVLILGAVGGNRQTAFNINTTGWFLCGVFLLMTTCTYAKDADKVQQQVGAALDKGEGTHPAKPERISQRLRDEDEHEDDEADGRNNNLHERLLIP